jgi:hypothetical protein
MTPLTFTDGSSGGPAANMGFLRRDSLIIVIVVSDVDDCSASQPAELIGLNDTGLLHRCRFNPPVVSPLHRYTDGLQQLRSGASDLVMFFALAGVPPAAVNDAAIEAVSFEREDQREAFYDRLLAQLLDPGLLDVQGTPEDNTDDLPVSLCTSTGPIYPAPRLVELTREFGANGMVQSLCGDDLWPALRTIARSIGARLGPPGI